MRTNRRRSTLDFARSLLARGAGAPLALAANVLLARTLGAGVYGRYLTLLSAALVAASTAGFGVSAVITREIAAQPPVAKQAMARAIVRWANILTAKYAVLTTSLLLLWFAFGPGAPASDWTQRLLAAALILPSIWIITFPAGLAGLMRVPLSEAISNTIKNALLLGGAWVMISLRAATAEDALIAQLSSVLIAALIGYRLFRHYALAADDKTAPGILTRHIHRNQSAWWRSSGYFFSMSLAMIVLMRLDVVIVNMFSNEVQAGLFGAAARLAQATQVIGLVWMAWLQPRMASAVARSDQQAVRHLLRTATLSISVMVVAVTIVAWLAAPPLMALFGSDFIGATLPFRLLLIANLAWCLIVPVYTLLIMSRAERTMSRLIWAQLVATIGLSVPLCERMGATGAAYAWAAGSVGLAIAVVTFWLRRDGPPIDSPTPSAA